MVNSILGDVNLYTFGKKTSGQKCIILHQDVHSFSSGNSAGNIT